MRSTCAMTNPLQFLAAVASARLSSVKCLLFHRDVAVVIGGGAPHNRDVDRKRLVEQPWFAIDFDQPHQLFGGARIQLAAAIGRDRRRCRARLWKGTGLAPRNLAKQMRNASERQIVSLDMVVDRHPRQSSAPAPKCPPTSRLIRPGCARRLSPRSPPIARRCRKHQREIPRLAGLDEAPFQRRDDFVGRADADEAGRGHGVAGSNDGNRLGGVDDLVAHQGSLPDWRHGRPASRRCSG